MKEPWIQTYTGKQYSYEEPTPDMICIEDIARALSHLCRFTGHCKKFYSVAQHSVLVSHQTKNPFLGLMHDADEAYTGDMCRPLKHSLQPGNKFILAGNGAANTVFAKYPQLEKSTYDDKVDCKYHDMRMLVTESHDLLLNGPHPEWRINQKTHPRYDFVIVPQSPDEAMESFLARFNELWNGQALLTDVHHDERTQTTGKDSTTMPLKLKRRVGQRIEIDEWVITITNITQGAVEMIIDAPQHVQIMRGEAKDKGPRVRTTSTALSHTVHHNAHNNQR